MMLKNVLLSVLLALPLIGFADGATQPPNTGASPAAVALINDLGLRESRLASRDMPGWSVPGKIVAWQGRPGLLQEFQAIAPGVEFVMVESVEQARKEAADAQAVLGYCDERMLSSAPGLFWVQVYSAGVERCLANPSMQSGKRLLTNGQRIGSPGLAEHSIAMMMMLARGLDMYHANQLKGKWVREAGLAREDHLEIEGRTLLVVGLGGIGTQVAKRGHGLGMRVLATRNSRREGPEYVEYVGLAHELNELAAKADVVINTVPLTDQTIGIFDAAFFDAMKPTAFFISVGRGRSTVTEDLVKALETGLIGGAGLDVTDPEPLPAGHPLWSMPRVIISPHTAGRSDKGRDRLFVMAKENLRRYVNGEPMLSVVDIEKGY